MHRLKGGEAHTKIEKKKKKKQCSIDFFFCIFHMFNISEEVVEGLMLLLHSCARNRDALSLSFPDSIDCAESSDESSSANVLTL